MDIIPDLGKANKVSKPEIEQVEDDKIEYTHLGTYLYRRGLLLFGYCRNTDTIREIKVVHSNTIHIIPIEGELKAVDLELEKAFVDPRLIYFEALNLKSAEKRVNRWKQGKILELFNLRKPSEEGIKLY